ncbi:MAG: LysE family transporter, partial [Flavobacteriales bacterium]
VNKKKNLSRNLLVYGLNGFIINFINPFVFAVWFGFYTYNQSMYEDNSVLFSLVVTLLVIFVTDILKAFFAQKLSPFLNKKRLKIIFKFFGLIMIGFAIRLIVLFFNL